MQIVLEVPKYDGTGFKFNWEDGFEISIKCKDGGIVLEANKAGLMSLANHLVNLAQDEIPSRYHFHLDDLNSLEEGSDELIIGKK